MKTISTALILSVTFACCSAQTVPGKLYFALPEHAGFLSLDQGNWKVAELSAKPNGNEWGVRAADGDLHLLAFLFVWPEKPNLTAETCREEMLKGEGARSLAAAKDRLSFKSANGVDIALVLMVPPNSTSSSIRAFVASGDLCGDLSFTSKDGVSPQSVKDALRTLQFDPNAKAGFRDAFAYATVEFEHRQYPGAAKAYRSALALVETSDDPLKWRRVTTDQLSMSLGISGDLKGSRAVNEAAIQRDPKYPLYYYNLACADAEEGNAPAAHTHLQQAFDRSSNTLAGEHMPDPASDDSIQKLKSDKAFWAFVQTLSAKAKQ